MCKLYRAQDWVLLSGFSKSCPGTSSKGITREGGEDEGRNWMPPQGEDTGGQDGVDAGISRTEAVGGRTRGPENAEVDPP